MCIVLFDIALTINNIQSSYSGLCRYFANGCQRLQTATVLPTGASQREQRKPHNGSDGRIIIKSGWWLTYPSEKYESQLGWWHSQIIWKNKIHVPNHQPEIVHRIRPRCIFLYKLLDVRWFILITHSGCDPSVCLAMKSPFFSLQSREYPRTGPGFTLNLLQGSKYEKPYGCMPCGKGLLKRAWSSHFIVSWKMLLLWPGAQLMTFK